MADNYHNWPNGTLVVPDEAKLLEHNYKSWLESADYLWKNQIGEVVKLPGSIVQLWWPGLNKFQEWTPVYIKRYKSNA